MLPRRHGRASVFLISHPAHHDTQEVERVPWRRKVQQARKQIMPPPQVSYSVRFSRTSRPLPVLVLVLMLVLMLACPPPLNSLPSSLPPSP